VTQRPATSRLELAGITKIYPSVVANDGIDLDVAPGEIHAVLGENGAGKSTLMKTLYGMHRPDSGTIAIDGKPMNRVAPKDRDVAMVFQSYALFPHMTVAENVGYGPRIAGRAGTSGARGLRYASADGMGRTPSRRRR